MRQKLADQAVDRKLKGSASAFVLTGLIYDDRGNRMTPSHANKKGIRYRYYVSQAVLRNRKDHVGSVTRVAAPDMEALVLQAIRQRESGSRESSPGHVIPTNHDPAGASIIQSDRDLILGSVARISIHKTRIDISLRIAEQQDADVSNPSRGDQDLESAEDSAASCATRLPVSQDRRSDRHWNGTGRFDGFAFDTTAPCLDRSGTDDRHRLILGSPVTCCKRAVGNSHPGGVWSRSYPFNLM